MAHATAPETSTAYPTWTSPQEHGTPAGSASAAPAKIGSHLHDTQGGNTEVGVRHGPRKRRDAHTTPRCSKDRRRASGAKRPTQGKPRPASQHQRGQGTLQPSQTARPVGPLHRLLTAGIPRTPNRGDDRRRAGKPPHGSKDIGPKRILRRPLNAAPYAHSPSPSSLPRREADSHQPRSWMDLHPVGP